MNEYGKRAQRAWQQLAPSAYAQIPNPSLHFSTLGQTAADQVVDLTTQLVGPDVPGESSLQKIGRWNAAKMQAEEIVAADLLTPPREQWDPASDVGDEPDPWGLELQRMNQERLKDREREWDTILRQPTDG